MCMELATFYVRGKTKEEEKKKQYWEMGRVNS